MNEDQLDIRVQEDGKLTLEFPYNADFIEYLKSRIPHTERSYEPETKIWTVPEKYLAAIEGVGVQKFSHVTRVYRRNDGAMVWRNVKSGAEMVQAGLFQ